MISMNLMISLMNIIITDIMKRAWAFFELNQALKVCKIEKSKYTTKSSMLLMAIVPLQRINRTSVGAILLLKGVLVYILSTNVKRKSMNSK